MKKLLRTGIAAITFLLVHTAYAQPIIHSHNDYTHAIPFWDAYTNQAGVIEADVYYINGELMVAHNKTDIKPANSLNNMYIQPIVKLFDTGQHIHSFYLMIDIKENPTATLPALINLLQQHPSVFNKEVNQNAVQVFISGERPADSTFHKYAAYIMFDGLPAQNYAPQDLKKVVMISDNFQTYSHWNGTGRMPAADSMAIANVITAAHALEKPVRLWGAPDTKQCWQTLINLHADVINTDKVAACRQFLNKLTDPH